MVFLSLSLHLLLIFAYILCCNRRGSELSAGSGCNSQLPPERVKTGRQQLTVLGVVAVELRLVTPRDDELSDIHGCLRNGE